MSPGCQRKRDWTRDRHKGQEHSGDYHGYLGRESRVRLPILSPSHPLPGDREPHGPGLVGKVRWHGAKNSVLGFKHKRSDNWSPFQPCASHTR